MAMENANQHMLPSRLWAKKALPPSNQGAIKAMSPKNSQARLWKSLWGIPK